MIGVVPGSNSKITPARNYSLPRLASVEEEFEDYKTSFNDRLRQCIASKVRYRLFINYWVFFEDFKNIPDSGLSLFSLSSVRVCTAPDGR